MDQEHFIELTWTFLLWGLPDRELAEWQAELDRRGEAGQAELSLMREAFASLALAAPPAVPSSSLRNRVMGGLGRMPGTGPAEGFSAAGAGPAAGSPARAGLAKGFPPAAAAPPPVTPLRGSPRAWILAAGVAALLAGLLAVWNVRLREDLKQTRSSLARTTADLGDTRAEADASSRELASARERIAAADRARAELQGDRRDLELLAAPAGSAHTLVGTAEQPGAKARVFIDPVTGRALLFAFDLPILPPGTVYELWAIRGGTPAAAGIFTTGSERRARVELESAAILQGADVLAVTIEPAPGVNAPTGKMVLSSSS